ncbi:NEDD8-specific protease 1-like [Rosa sericea]
MFTVNDNVDTSQSDGGKQWSLLVYYRKSNTFMHYDSFGGFNSLVARKLYRAVKNCVATPATQLTQAPTPAGTSSLVTNISSKMGHKYYSRHLRRIINYPKKNMLVSSVIGYILSKKYLRRFINYHPMKVCYALQKYIINNNGDDEETIDRDDDDVNDHRFREENVMPQQTNWYDCGLYVMAIARVICEWYYDEERAEQEQQNCFLKDDRFPNITKHLDNSLEHTMRSEMLGFIQHHIELKSN